MRRWLKRVLRGSRPKQVTGGSTVVRRLKRLWKRRWLHRTINYKLVIGLVLGGALFGAGVHFLHAYQVKRNASAFLDQAQRAEQDGDLEQAAKYLHFYLNLVPGDTAVLARYGLTLEKLARPDRTVVSWRQLQEAFLRLEEVIRRQGDRHDVRRRLVMIAMDLGRFDMALQHLKVLLDATPDNGELELLAGRCASALGRLEEAQDYLEKALKHPPRQIDAYVELAALYRHKLRQPDQANRVMDELVQDNPSDPRAYVARVRYYGELGERAQVEKDVTRALQEHPNDPDVTIAAVNLALGRGDFPEARRFLKRALQAHPRHDGLHKSLAETELRAGQPDKAIDILDRAAQVVERPDDLLPLRAEALIEAGRFAEVEEVISRLRQQRKNPAAIRYLEARVLVRKGEWVEGARALEQLRPELAVISPTIDRLLIQCYKQIGDAPRRLEACQRLVAANPLAVTPRLELAQALLAAGSSESALEEYLKAASQSPLAKVRAAQLLAARQLRLPSDRREWDRVEQLLDEAEEAMPQSVEVPVVRAQILVLREKFSEARRVLEAARGQLPERIELTLALASVINLQEGPEKALALLESADDSPAVRLARSLYRAGRQPAEARKELAELERSLDALPRQEQAQYLQELALGYNRLGDSAEVERLWKRAAECQPHNLTVRLGLFDLARKAGDEAAMRRLLDEIRRIDGPEGACWRQAEAAWLLTRARRGDTAALKPAHAHLNEAARLQPNLPRVSLLQAELKELEGDTAGALAHYREAIRLGERRPEVIGRAVQLLYALGRGAEANDLFRGLGEPSTLSGDLGRMAAEVSLHAQDRERALELARAAVPASSTDYRQHLWQGQILAALGQKAEAEQALRRAVALADTSPDTWVALVQFLAGVDLKKAAAEIERAQARIPEAQAPLALACCYEAVGQRDQAARYYRLALERQPGDVNVWRATIRFFLRQGDYARAEPLLRQLATARGKVPEADAAWARRELAYGLALTGDQARLEEALALLDQNRKGAEPALEDLRTRALVLATRGRRVEAIQILEDLDARQALSAEDRFRLVQLYEAVQDGPKAEDHLRRLLTTHSTNPRYLAHHAHNLLKKGALEQAEARLAELEKADPDSFTTVSVKARLRQAQRRGDEAIALVKKYAEDKPAGMLVLAAGLLEEIGQTDAAEEMYRRFVDRSGRPDDVLVLIQFLARRQRLDEALSLCEKAWGTCPAEAVGAVSAAALRLGKSRPEHQKRVESWLRKACEQAPASVSLQISLADVYELQGHYDDAQQIYRRVAAGKIPSIIALNNLAWLLTLKEQKAEEALPYIEAAVKLAGPLPELLDTRAVVHIGRGRPDLAIKDLKEAIAQAPTPSRYFHLAQAHQLAQDRKGAREALQKAQALGLQPEGLHPLEQGSYRRLAAELP